MPYKLYGVAMAKEGEMIPYLQVTITYKYYVAVPNWVSQKLKKKFGFVKWVTC